MGLCVGHESSLRYWLTKTGDEALPEHATPGAFRQAEATSALVKEGTLPFGPEPSSTASATAKSTSTRGFYRTGLSAGCLGPI